MIDQIVRCVISNKLIQRKNHAGLTYSEIARLIGVKPNEMPLIFRGEGRPWRVSKLSKVLELLDLTIEDVLKDQVSLSFWYKWIKMVENKEVCNESSKDS